MSDAPREIGLLEVAIVPEGFRAALRADPGDMTARLVLADWLDENDRSREADAWRWAVDLNLCPVFVTAELASGEYIDDAYRHKWNWFGGEERGPLHRAGWPDGTMPDVDVERDPFVLLASMVERYVNADEELRTRLDEMEPRKPYKESTP